jgi:hypothetical protein
VRDLFATHQKTKAAAAKTLRVDSEQSSSIPNTTLPCVVVPSEVETYSASQNQQIKPITNL